MDATQQQKGEDFCALHEGEAFVIPNPWDAGSARVMAALGFKALRVRRLGGWTFHSPSPRAPRTTSGATQTWKTRSPACRRSRAGASVVFAPGLRSPDQIREVCEATTVPVNVLAHRGLSMEEVVESGAGRISVGGGLAWAAVEAMAAAAKRMRDEGDFSGLAAPTQVREWLTG